MKTNTLLYAIIGIVVLAVVGFGGYRMWQGSQIAITQSAGTTTQQAGSTPAAGLPNKGDTSNAQLDKDVQSVQSSMDQLSTDQNATGQDTANQAQDTPQQ